MFHNLNYERIFLLESVCLVVASFSYSCAWAVHYQGKDMGELQPKKFKGKAIEVGKILIPFVSDIILVAIGFYAGDEKGNGFHLLPFLLLGSIAAGSMILSEVQHFRWFCLG